MMKAHINTTSAMHHPYHHRQPQDRPISLVRRTKENPVVPSQVRNESPDVVSIITPKNQRHTNPRVMYKRKQMWTNIE